MQGTVWFAAHVVACPLIALYLLWSLDARRPLLGRSGSGARLQAARPARPCWACCSWSQAALAARRLGRQAPTRACASWSCTGCRPALASRPRAGSLPLALPIRWGVCGMWMNHARFEDPFEFGHGYLPSAGAGASTRGACSTTTTCRRISRCSRPPCRGCRRCRRICKLSRHGLALLGDHAGCSVGAVAQTQLASHDARR